jgi:hypothetical protein
MAYDPSLRSLGIGDPTDADRRREAREDARQAAAEPAANPSYGAVLEREGAWSRNLAIGVAARVYPAISALDPPTPAGLPYQYGAPGGTATLDTPASLERRPPASMPMSPSSRAKARVWVMDLRTGRPTPPARAGDPIVSALLASGALSSADPLTRDLTRREAAAPPAPVAPTPEQPAAPLAPAAPSSNLPRWLLPAAAAVALVAWMRTK